MLEIQEGQRLSGAARRLLTYVEQHPNAVLVSSAADLGTRIEASDATVIRAIQSLGYEGLPHLKTVIAEKLDEGVRAPVEKVGVTMQELEQESDAGPFDLVTQSYQRSLQELGTAEIGQIVDQAIAVLAQAGRIVLYGAGPSARLVEQTATHLQRIGRQAYVVSGGGSAFADALLSINVGDTVIMLAHGKAITEARLLKAEALRLGSNLIVITDNPQGYIAKDSDITIPVPRTEVGNMMLYGTTLMVLESLVLGLTKDDGERALDAAARLGSFRSQLNTDGSSN